MPGKSQELLELLRVDTNNPLKRTFTAAVYGSDADYGENLTRSTRGLLFPPLLTDE